MFKFPRVHYSVSIFNVPSRDFIFLQSIQYTLLYTGVMLLSRIVSFFIVLSFTRIHIHIVCSLQYFDFRFADKYIT